MKVGLILNTVQFEYSLFALPFAGVGSLLAARGMPSPHDLFWIALAVLGARNAALGLNRIIDRDIDRVNPRTKEWAMPSGKVSNREMIAFIILCLVVFIVAVLNLHPLCLYFLPLVLFILFIYSYTKRFSWLCHFVLGMALAWAPLGAWIAIRGTLNLAPLLLGLGVMFWIAGFDTIYACLDLRFDQSYGLYSIPARFGLAAGLYLPMVFHLIALFLFFWVGIISQLGSWYYWGVLVSGIILAYQHSLVSSQNLNRINANFFSLNKLVSLVIFFFTLIDFLIG